MENFIIKTYLSHNLNSLLAKVSKLHPGKFPDAIVQHEQVLLSNAVTELTVNIIPVVATPVDNPTTVSATNRIHTIPEPEKRCHARVMDMKNPITQTDSGELIYGKQCSRHILTDGGLYCKQHIKNNIHEDFDKEPSQRLREHFIKKHRKVNPSSTVDTLL